MNTNIIDGTPDAPAPAVGPVPSRIAELPTTWRDRVAGESRFNLKKWLPKYAYWYGYALLAGLERRFGLAPMPGRVPARQTA